jgi:hypothetical protein
MTDNRDTWIAEANVKLDDAISHLEKAARGGRGRHPASAHIATALLAPVGS